MLRSAAVLILSAAAVAAGAPPSTSLSDSLVNGDFARPLEAGWVTQAGDPLGSHTIARLPDGGVLVSKEMCGHASITQDVRLSTPAVVLRARARLRAEATVPGYHSAASILLGYLDTDGKLLGETRLFRAAGKVPWKNSAVLHLIPVTDSARWEDYAVDVARELKTSLPGVDPAEVARLRIRLESYCSGTDAC